MQVTTIWDAGFLTQVMQTNNPESGFNSDHTIRQYAHGLLLESPFVPSSIPIAGLYEQK